MPPRSLLRRLAGSLALSLAALLAAPPPAPAQNYPVRPITLIVPWGPGGGTSINARALAPYLQKALGETVIVDNREGAGGITGHTLGAFAKPDGYLLTLVTPGIAAAPWIVPNVRFTPEDYSYIGQVTFVPNMIVVNAESAYHSLADLVAAMKARPGEISTGFLTGWPSSTVAQEIFLAKAGVKAKVVPGFKGGAEMIAAVLGQHIDFGFVNLNEAMPLYEAKKVRILAVSAPARAAALPDTPTFKEQGYDVDMGVWRTLAAPRGTPQPIIDKLSHALQTALESPELKADFAKLELSEDYLDPQATHDLVMADYRKLGELFHGMGLALKKTPAAAP